LEFVYEYAMRLSPPLQSLDRKFYNILIWLFIYQMETSSTTIAHQGKNSREKRAGQTDEITRYIGYITKTGIRPQARGKCPKYPELRLPAAIEC
jgi:hypothetical protein